MSEGPPGTSHALVRPAARDDIPALVVLARRAFINDPFTNYCGDLKEVSLSIFPRFPYSTVEPSAQALSNDVSTPKRQHLEIFYRMLFGAIIHSGGRVMVVAVPIPPKSDNGQSTGAERKRNRRRDKIAAVAAWLPPHVRIGLDHPWALLRSGLVGAVRRWGLKGAHVRSTLLIRPRQNGHIGSARRDRVWEQGREGVRGDIQGARREGDGARRVVSPVGSDGAR